MKKAIVAALLGTLVVAMPAAARADEVRPGEDSGGHVIVLKKGMKELGAEGLLVVSSSTTAESKAGANDKASSFALSFIGGAVFRYFVIDNLAATVHLGGLYNTGKESAADTTLSKTSAAGFVGTVGADYLISLSRGVFFNPGFSVGGFYSTLELTAPAVGTAPESISRFTQSGFAVRGGMGVALYSSHHFNVFARPEAIALIGSSKLTEQGGKTVSGDAADSRGFTNIRGGFSVGASYAF